jgi:hypothetical protein
MSAHVWEAHAGFDGDAVVASAPKGNGHDEDTEGIWTDRAIAFWRKLTDPARATFRSPLWTSPAAQHSERVLDIVRFTHAKGLALADLLSMATFDDGFGMPKYREFHLTCAREQWAGLDAADAERKAFAATLFDPWGEIEPPAWPAGVLRPDYEATIAALAKRDGLDLGALAMAYVIAVSGAANKQARFEPYQHPDWSVPPIVYAMPIADSGFRKTAIIGLAFAAIDRRDKQEHQEYLRALADWEAMPEANRPSKPAEPPPRLLDDIGAEKLQAILAKTPRGAVVLRDEIAPLFDFKRYSKGIGAEARALYLSAYEGTTRRVHRMSRETVYGDIAAAVFGGCQPSRLADFGDLGKDGLLQRFVPLVISKRQMTEPDTRVTGRAQLDQAIDLLMVADDLPDIYRTTPEGTELIRNTERAAFRLAEITDYGEAFQGFCAKLTGLHARLAFVLHLFGEPDTPVISADTIDRASRITAFCLNHARAFYSRAPGSSLEITKSVAGFILTRPEPISSEPERIVASQLTSGCRSCRGMTLKRLAEILDPLVAGGWLTAETPYADCNAWIVTPGLRAALQDRRRAEAQRRQAVRELIIEASAGRIPHVRA